MKDRKSPLIVSSGSSARGFNTNVVAGQKIFVAKNYSGELLPTVEVVAVTDLMVIEDTKAFMFKQSTPFGTYVSCATDNFDFIGTTLEAVENLIKQAKKQESALKDRMKELIAKAPKF